MNQERIGKFIAKCRKEKNLTQSELAAILGVSDKTISNWENARCMPDLSLFKILCQELGITINELISGEKLKKEIYQEKLEENIIDTINYSAKKVLEKEKIIFELILVFGLFLVFIAFTIFPSDSSWGSIFSVIGIIISFVGFNGLNKIKNTFFKILVNFSYVIGAFCILLLVDYTNVYLNNKPPRFSLYKEAVYNMIIYKTPFYNVYRINFDTTNEYYIIDTKKEYSKDSVPISPFNRSKSGIDNLIKYQNKYVGNNSNTGNLINNLPLAEYGYSFEIDSDGCGLIINYHMTYWYIKNSYYLEKSLFYNTVSLFALIENLEYIDYNFSGKSYRITKDYFLSNYDDFKYISNNNEINKGNFNLYLEDKVNDEEFSAYYFKRFFINTSQEEVKKIIILRNKKVFKEITDKKILEDFVEVINNAVRLPEGTLINDDGYGYEIELYSDKNEIISRYLFWQSGYLGFTDKEYKLSYDGLDKLRKYLDII